MDQADHSGTGKIRVLIAKDVRVLRDGLASLLLRWPEVTVVDCTLLGYGQKRQLEDPVDLVLMEVHCGMETFVEQIREVKTTLPGAKVIVLGVPDTAREILACIEAGAASYISVDDPIQRLIDTIRMVHRGEGLCPPDVLPLLFSRIVSLKDQLTALQGSELDKLTRRELEILQLVADGMSNKEIASLLNLELQTVKNYVHSILQKLRVRDRREAAVYTRKLLLAETVSLNS